MPVLRAPLAAPPPAPPTTPLPTPAATPAPAAPQLPPAGLNSNFQNNFHHGISLLHGWLPITVELLAVAALVLAIGWRTRRWRLVWLPVCVLIGGAGALAAWAYMNDQGLASDPAPPLLWVCVAATFCAIAVAVLGWRGARWWRRGVSVLAVPLALLSTGLVLNQWVGYYPTWQSAWSSLTAGPLPNQTDISALAGLRGTNVTSGKIVPVQIPDSGSNFPHRTEYVYLPPAWFAGATPPQLPVVMMIAGEFNTPADWVRSGQIMPAVDKFTASNGGRAPILAFVDSSGSFNNDTECVNGPRGDAADHLTRDVPSYLESRFGASADPANWAVVGWSMGGTCAVDLTVMHPELFHTFVDIAGDLGPTSGDKEQTIRRLYGGDAAQWDRFDPLTVMAKHGRYTGVAGLFDDLTPPQRSGGPGRPGNFHPPKVDEDAVGFGGHDGVYDTGEVGAAEKLCDAGHAVGIDCTIHTTKGGHTWQFATAAFTSSFPWVVARVGLPVPNQA
ncbi:MULTISPECIES: alpha/beta hydrolase family protein [unclassified Nocardia]|uniref:alpha/beta hydrolase n=1 Tax=unclassified Nocardia TaxID=2637762 RepID=UPI001CE3FFC8|nr:MULTISPECIES: alpha/beta hydrolase-fold protein [unclassified Nocardia]